MPELDEFGDGYGDSEINGYSAGDGYGFRYANGHGYGFGRGNSEGNGYGYVGDGNSDISEREGVLCQN